VPVALRLPDPGVSALRAGCAHPGDLMSVLPAQPATLRQGRSLVQQWLADQHWPSEDAQDVVLAVHEAVANVVDHAYPPTATGSVHLHAWVSVEPRTRARRVVATVTDRGCWRAEHRAAADPTSRGYGLVMMSGCMAEMHIQRSASGTTVILISPTVPPAHRPLSCPEEKPRSRRTEGGTPR
jgi:serine/threonine-protein kinase RsbW